jgi:hypothetical protein
MPIYYGLIAKKNNVILCEYTEYAGNFQQYTMQLMSRIEAETKKTFELEDFLFHYINEDGLTVLCMTDKDIQKKVAFAFMADVRKQVLQTYTPRELENAKAYQLSTFIEKLREKMVSQIRPDQIRCGNIILHHNIFCEPNSWPDLKFILFHRVSITTTLSK